MRVLLAGVVCLASATASVDVRSMLRRYPSEASRLTATRTRISTSTRYSPLTLSALQREIDEGRPGCGTPYGQVTGRVVR